MRQEPSVPDRIMGAVARSPGCLLEELVLACPTLTWNQVFLEVDRLTRAGQLRLKAQGPGMYSVWPVEVHLKTQLLSYHV